MIYKRSFLLLLLCLSSPASSAVAQSFFTYFEHYEIGFGYQQVVFDEYELFNGGRVPGRRETVTIHTGTMNFGWNLPVIKVGNASTVGINAMLFAIARPGTIDGKEASGSSALLSFNLPLLATYKYGADATFRPQTRWGFGAGLGYQPSLLLGTELITYGTIVGMFEVAHAGNLSAWKLRGTISLGTDIQPDFTIRGFNISVACIPKF